MNKKDLSESDICAKFITPAVQRAGWDEMTQLRREVSFTKGRARGGAERGAGAGVPATSADGFEVLDIHMP